MTKVIIYSGYTSKPIGEGTVIKTKKNWVEVHTPLYARPVRYRTSGSLAGRRITGGLAEWLNDHIHLPVGSSHA